jgi:hypothetical protein
MENDDLLENNLMDIALDEATELTEEVDGFNPSDFNKHEGISSNAFDSVNDGNTHNNFHSDESYQARYNNEDSLNPVDEMLSE